MESQIRAAQKMKEQLQKRVEKIRIQQKQRELLEKEKEEIIELRKESSKIWNLIYTILRK